MDEKVLSTLAVCFLLCVRFGGKKSVICNELTLILHERSLWWGVKLRIVSVWVDYVLALGPTVVIVGVKKKILRVALHHAKQTKSHAPPIIVVFVSQ